MSSNSGPSQDALLLAYQEAFRGFDSIQTFRVKLLAFLPLASGGVFLLLTVLPQARVYLPAVGAFGFLTTVGLFLYELHAMRDCKHLLACAAVLERQLGLPSGDYRAYPDNLSLVGPIGAAWIIYPTVMLAWAYIAYAQLHLLYVFLPWALVVGIGLPLFLRQIPGWRKALNEAWRGQRVFAHVTVIEGNPSRLEEGQRYDRDQVIPRAKKQPGFKGGYWLTNRATGKTMAVTFWENEKAVKASEAVVAPLREEGTRSLGARVVSVEVYEVTNQA